MVKRKIALYNKKCIGIEYIYSVGPNGEQINLKDKIEKIRKLGRNNQLFCPCGCGANLILVAGDRGLREQHFRIIGKEKENCEFNKINKETKESIDSKIVLKMWVDNVLNDKNLETRVEFDSDILLKRRYELTLFSKEFKFAINYVRQRTDIEDDKLDAIDKNKEIVTVLHVLSIENDLIPNQHQYPENLIKIQNRQGYCLFLKLGEENNLFNTTKYKVSIYKQCADGLWQSIDVLEGLIKDFSIKDCQLTYKDRFINDYIKASVDKFVCKQEEINREKEEMDKKREERKKEEEKKWEEQRTKSEKAYFENIETRRDNKKYKCIYCGKIAGYKEFSTYGGEGEKESTGKCWECYKKIDSGELKLEDSFITKTKQNNKYNPNTCPDCGGMLVRKKGRYGDFIGCRNYPKCKFTRNV